MLPLRFAMLQRPPRSAQYPLATAHSGPRPPSAGAARQATGPSHRIEPLEPPQANKAMMQTTQLLRKSSTRAARAALKRESQITRASRQLVGGSLHIALFA